MKRSDVLRLREERWGEVGQVKPPMRVCVVPSAGTDMVSVVEFASVSDQQKDRICQRVFVNFDTYEDEDGKAIPNSLAARRELIDISAVFFTVQELVLTGQLEVVQGEESADSD